MIVCNLTPTLINPSANAENGDLYHVAGLSQAENGDL